MNKNVYASTKSWKSSQEASKIMSSQIIENIYVPTIPHHQPVHQQIPYISKQQKFHTVAKTGTIQRHYSEDDFKKFMPGNK